MLKKKKNSALYKALSSYINYLIYILDLRPLAKISKKKKRKEEKEIKKKKKEKKEEKGKKMINKASEFSRRSFLSALYKALFNCNLILNKI